MELIAPRSVWVGFDQESCSTSQNGTGGVTFSGSSNQPRIASKVLAEPAEKAKSVGYMV
jgi:hypothetical protein